MWDFTDWKHYHNWSRCTRESQWEGRDFAPTLTYCHRRESNFWPKEFGYDVIIEISF